MIKKKKKRYEEKATIEEALLEVDQAYREFRSLEEGQTPDLDTISKSFGDLLFSLSNAALCLNIDAELSLAAKIKEYIRTYEK